ncbi:MAG: MFS transporter [Methanomassiliicoccales archaeon]|jgi:DHA3 family macrolide efflux protein-like MFS transporter
MGKVKEKWFKRFATIWAGQAASLVGSQLVQFALVWYLTIQTGSATILAIASVAAMLPQILLSPIAGAYVDRWKRRHVMIAADAFIATSTFVLIVLFALGYAQIWHIFVIMFVRSCFSAFHWPASQAATAMLVPEEHLTRVAGMNQSLQGIANILAPPIAAVLIAFLPIEQVLAFDIITAFLAILPLLAIRFPEPVPKIGPRQKVVADLKEAFAYLRGWRGALALMAMFMVINMLISPAFSLLPILVVQFFHGGAFDYASMEAVAGIGLISGGILLSIWGGTKKKIVTIMASTILAGIGISLIAFVPQNGFIFVLGLLLFVGLMLPILNGTVMALLQACVPKGMQGRVFALMGALAMAAAPIGLAFGGPVADLIGIQPWFLIAGIPTALIGVTAFFLPNVMGMENPGSRPEYKEEAMEVPASQDVES